MRATCACVSIVTGVIGIALLLPARAAATTIGVNTTADVVSATDGHCSLREAVVAANTNSASGGVPGECPGGSPFVPDEIDLGAGTFSLPGGELSLQTDMSIVGQGDGRTAVTTIAGTGAGRLLHMTGGTVTLRGLELTGGRAPDGVKGVSGGQSGGAILKTGGDLTVLACRFVSNAAGNDAGGQDQSGGIGSDGIGGEGIQGGHGGGIASFAGLLTVRDSTFESNHAGNGGAGGNATGGQPAFDGDTGHDGFGGRGGDGGNGGAIDSEGGATVISGTTFTNNAAGNGGPGGTGTGSNGFNGTAGGNGTGGPGGQGGCCGAIVAYPVPVDISATTFSGNRAGRGGDGGTGRSSPNDGGNATGGHGNRGGGGGAVLMGAPTAPTLATNVTLTGNSTGAGGAGGTGVLLSGTGTAAAGSGGDGGAGGGLTLAGTVEVHHGTFVGDSVGGGGASGGAGGSAGAAGKWSEVDIEDPADVHFKVGGSILAPGGCTTSTDLGYNLGGGGCAGAPGDPKLGPLQDNGGPAPTMKPAAGSAAIDQEPASGSVCPATDARGAVRPVGSRCDLGAVEIAPPSATTGDATGIGATAATLGGTVSALGLATTYHFDYGKTAAYGQATPSAVDAAAGPAPVSGTLASLAQNTLYHYRLVATSPDGVSVGADRTFTTRDTTPPRVDEVAVNPSTFALAKASTPVAAHKKGATIRYRLSEAAATVLAVQRPVAGLKLKAKRGGRARCVPATARNKRTRIAQIKHALGRHATPQKIAAALKKARCTAYRGVGSLRRRGKAGVNRVAFSGRIGVRPLRPARYRLAITATDAAGNTSKPATATFKVVRK